MKRLLAVILGTCLALASAAEAKGPSATLRPAPGPLEAGRPWRAVLELMELGRARPPVQLVARRDGTEVVARLRELRSRFTDVRRFGVALTFPADGSWRLVATADGRFEFTPVRVGGGRPYRSDTAFAGVPHQRATPLPPEAFVAADGAGSDGGGDGSHGGGDGGLPAWVLPLAGLALAGAGALSLRSRLSLRRRSGGGPRRLGGRPS